MSLKKLKQTKIFFDLTSKKNQKILLFFLFSFSAYCAIVLGKSWDEGPNLFQGKNTLEYLFSLGKNNNYYWGREYYSGFYWSLQYLLTTIFPSKFQISISHIINLIFSISAIIGVNQISKELFNKNVGKIIFLVLFFYPVFFGHMPINPKDTILAFSHVWITLLAIKYLKKQSYNKNSASNYFLSIGVILALATGIQLFFLASLIPIIFFILFEIFLFKKIVNKNFDKKIFLLDIIKSFIVFYFLLILFWIDAHPNILVLPYKIFYAALTNTFATGWPTNLVNGSYYLSHEVPKFYLLINLIYKSPEYFLITYILFFVLIIKSNLFFKRKFNYFNYKIYFISFILLYSIFLVFLVPFPLYDGMRLFLWSIPYFCIIPGLTIYYLFKNFNKKIPKITSIFLSLCVVYFFYNFFTITPYQYTYLNALNGDRENRYQRFENDYWGVSIKELIKRTNFENNEKFKIATCGVNSSVVNKYLKQKGIFINKFFTPKESDYLIMTNRVTFAGENGEYSRNLTNCLDKFKGKNISQVKRNNLILSVVRKIQK